MFNIILYHNFSTKKIPNKKPSVLPEGFFITYYLEEANLM